MEDHETFHGYKSIACVVETVHDRFDACTCSGSRAVTMGENGGDAVLRWWRSGGVGGGTEDGNVN